LGLKPMGQGGKVMRRFAAFVALSILAATVSVVEAAPASAAAPAAPTGVTAVAGDGLADVSWTAPVDDPLDPITGYQVASSPPSAGCTSTGTSCTVGGLINGTAYSFTVYASSAIGGDGASSTPSNSVTPVAPPPPPTVPDPPTNVSATAGTGGTALVTWFAPAITGGAAIDKYVVSSSAPVKKCQTGGTLQCTVSGLTKGGTYTFTVLAHNSVGNSTDSAPSNQITLANAPAAPTGVTATSGLNQTVEVIWVAALDNGSPVTSYRATASPGGAFCTVAAPAITCNVIGLTNGTAYTFTVTATNVEGTSSPSAASLPATPAFSPGPVRIPALVAGRGTAHLTWAAPLDNGGSPIVDYIVTATPGTGVPIHTVGAVTSMNLTGLVSGRSISFRIQARNSALGLGQLGIPTSIVGVGTGVTGTPYPPRVSYGVRTRIAGRLITTIGTSLPLRPLLVQSRPLGSLTWRGLARISTNRSGVYGAFVRPSVNTQYRVLFPGGIRVMGGASHNILVGVAWRFRVKQSARRIFAGSSVTWSGSILPVKVNKAILLQKYESRRWITKQTARTNIRSRFVFKNTPKKLGTFQYRLYVSASGGHLASVTGRMTLTVVVKPKARPKPKPPSATGAFTVSVTQSSSSVASGGVVVFSGRVSPSKQPKTVLLQRIEGGRWVTKQSVASTAAGLYRLAYLPTKRGTFTYRMFVAGTSAHKAGASRLMVLTIR